jgi:putative ABC transport system permease protein
VRQLVRLVLLRYLSAARGRVTLTVLGIVLGVAVVFSVSLVNASVLGAFRQSIANITGKAKLSVGAEVGVDEEALERIRAVRGVDSAIPIIELTVRDVRAHVQLAVLALDTLSDPNARGYDVASEDAHVDDVVSFLNDPHGVLITPTYAKRTGVKVGETLLLDTPQGRTEFKIHGTLEPRGIATVYGGDLLLMDVYAAQVAFDRGRRFDRIDVIPASGVAPDVLARDLELALEHKVPVSRAERRAEEAERLVAGYRLALSLASLVALFVGGFIIYNSLAIAVAQRRKDIGILRALGTTRAQVLLLFVGEGLIIGLAGAAIGLGVGYGLARASLGAVAAAVSSLYLPIKVGTVVVGSDDVAIALALGVTSAMLAAFVPARRASTIDPVSAMSGTIQGGDIAPSLSLTSLQAAGVALVATAVAAAAAHAYQLMPLALLVACLILVSGVFFASPLAALVSRIAQRYALRLGPATLLGAVSFARNRARNTVAIAALGLALANVVNADTLIDSMKAATGAWLGRSFRADIFVFAGTEVHAKFEHPLPKSLRTALQAIPLVEFVQAFRMVRRTFRGQPFYLLSEDFEGYRRYNELPVVAGDVSRALSEIEAGTGIAASETFTQNFKLSLGDSVTLDTPDGPKSFRIALVYTDYRADIGILFTTRSAYERIFHDELVDLYSVYVSDRTSVEHVRAQIAHSFGERYGLLALGSDEYKRDLVGVIDRTMSLARATELVAVVVAGLGIINALLVGVLDRRREIGVLKALGANRNQVSRVVLVEAILIACTAALLGTLLGIVLSAYMVLEALRIEVGWNISLHLSGWILAEAFVLAIPIAVLAAWWPIRWATRLEVVDALQYE